MKRMELAGLVVEATSGAPVVVLREHDEPHRLLSIFIGGPEATAIAIAASGQMLPRPLTFDVMATLLQSLDGSIDSAEITELSDGAYLANLTVDGPNGRHWLDTRPSDAIALAVRVGAPLFVSEAVLDEAGVLPEPEPVSDHQLDEAAIDETVTEFRAFLDQVVPSQFERSGPEEVDQPFGDAGDAVADGVPETGAEEPDDSAGGDDQAA
jgi:uncharacterized protein